MFGCFCFFGLFFIAVGCAFIDGVYDDSDIKKKEVASNARDSIKTATAKQQSSGGADQEKLINDSA